MASFDTMTCLLENPEQVSSNHPRYPKNYQDKDSKIIVDSAVTFLCVIYYITAGESCETEEINN